MGAGRPLQGVVEVFASGAEALDYSAGATLGKTEINPLKI